MTNKKHNEKHLWLNAYPPHVSGKSMLIKEPVSRLFDRAAHVNPNGTCANFMGKKYSYAKMQKRINRFAASLNYAGAKKGDRIGICLPNVPDFLVAYFGALKAGCIVVNFNPLLTTEELTLQAKDSGIKIMITLNVKDVYYKVETACEAAGVEHIVVSTITNCLPNLKKILFRIFKARELARIKEHKGDGMRVSYFKTFISHNTSFTQPFIDAEKDIALFQYTGGTTGLPKAAKLTHSNIMSNAAQVTEWLGKTQPNEKFLAVLPFFHVFSMTASMNLAISTASEIVMLPRFDLKQVLKTIQKEKITIFPAVPTIFTAINNVDDIHNHDLTSIRFCISGGAALPNEVHENFTRLTDCVLVEGYGCTEASPVICCNPPHISTKVGSIGLPLPGTVVSIRNPEDLRVEVEQGDRGEICVSGPQVMQAYHNRPGDNEDIFITGNNDDTLLRTGDVGYMDEDGYIFLTDRIKDIIISSGYNVYPRLIEDAFYKHPDVEEVIVIAIPHEYKGEAPKAFVKLKEGGKVTETELLDFTANLLNPIEKPVEVEFRDVLPKTLIGKLSKKELKAEVAQSHKK